MGVSVLEIAWIQCKTKNDKRDTRRYPITTLSVIWGYSAPKTTHEVLKLMLRSGETFVVDLSGAHYGYYDAVMGWEEYERTRIHTIVTSDPPPKSQGVLEVQDYSFEEFKTKKPFGAPLGVLGNILEIQGFHMAEWQREGGTSLKALWKLPKAKFMEKQSNLVDFLEWKLHNSEKPYFTMSGKRLEEAMKGKRCWEYAK